MGCATHIGHISLSQMTCLSLTATMCHIVKALLGTKAAKGPCDKWHQGPSLIP